jgi:TonB family protein
MPRRFSKSISSPARRQDRRQPHDAVRLGATLLGAALLGLASLGSAPAWAQEDDEFMNLDLGGGPTEVSEDDAEAFVGAQDDRWKWSWPKSSRLDPDNNKIHVSWREGSGTMDEVLSLEDVIRLERAREYEDRPDELFALLADGRRVLVSQGADVATHAIIAKAITRIPVKELPPGEGHFSKVESNAPPPVLRVGPGAGVVYRTSERTDLALEGEPRRSGGTLRKVAEDDHPGLQGEGGGKLEKYEIELVFKQKMGIFIRCYQRELQRNPELRGKVVVRFVVGAEGSVTHAHLRATSLENAVVESCVVDEVRRTRFPRPEDDGSVIVSYPFNFGPL